jgi:type IV secretion system protein VirD4
MSEPVNPGVHRRHAARDWQPPRAAPTSTTYGDARFADPACDYPAMQDILGGTGVCLGQAFHFGDMPGDNDPDISYRGDRHLLTVAPTRSGKGACAIIPNLLIDSDHSIICIDPKGQNAAVTTRARGKVGSVYCLNPFGLHSGTPWHLPRHCYNPLAHLTIDHPYLSAEAAALAQALIVTESKTQPYFENSARDLVKILILHAIATKRSEATLLDMRAWLAQPWEAPPEEPSLTRTIFEMSRSEHSFIREPAARFLSDARSIGEIIQSAANQTEFLSDPVIAYTLSGNDFSMEDFKRQVTTLFIILPDNYLDSYSRFFRLIVISALNGLRSRPGGRKTWVMLDEFARLGHLEPVENAFTLAAGYNVQIWPFVQDLSQLKQTYGDRWESFIANAGVVQWFTPNDHFTAEYLSKRIGKTTIATQTSNVTESSNKGAGRGASFSAGPGGRSRNMNDNVSHSQSKSETYAEAAADCMSPQDLYDLPDYLQIVTLAGFKFPILAARERYYEWGRIMVATKSLADPDQFHEQEATGELGQLVGIPALSPGKGNGSDSGIQIGLKGEEFDLTILSPPAAPQPEAIAASVEWVEPLRARNGRQQLSAIARRVALLVKLDDGFQFVVHTRKQNGDTATIAFPLASLDHFEIKRAGDMQIPPAYQVLQNQIIDPGDLALCAVTNEHIWPLTTTNAPREQVGALQAALAENFLPGAQVVKSETVGRLPLPNDQTTAGKTRVKRKRQTGAKVAEPEPESAPPAESPNETKAEASSEEKVDIREHLVNIATVAGLIFGLSLLDYLPPLAFGGQRVNFLDALVKSGYFIGVGITIITGFICLNGELRWTHASIKDTNDRNILVTVSLSTLLVFASLNAWTAERGSIINSLFVGAAAALFFFGVGLLAGFAYRVAYPHRERISIAVESALSRAFSTPRAAMYTGAGVVGLALICFLIGFPSHFTLPLSALGAAIWVVSFAIATIKFLYSFFTTDPQ